MRLHCDTHLGPYEIIAPIGAGGIGEVYRAKDTKLSRDVALKILPASFTNDPERVARFRSGSPSSRLTEPFARSRPQGAGCSMRDTEVDRAAAIT